MTLRCAEYLLGSYYGRPAGQLVSPYQAIAERAAAQGMETQLLTGTEVMGTGALLVQHGLHFAVINA